jgi:hypothetical protein
VDRYGDRTRPATYEVDEVVGVGPANSTKGYEGWIWLPERLFARMQHIATGYELHVLPRLEPYGRNVLAREQTETLLDEIGFIEEVTADPALHAQIDRIREVALRAVSSPKATDLVIEGP